MAGMAGFLESGVIVGFGFSHGEGDLIFPIVKVGREGKARDNPVAVLFVPSVSRVPVTAYPLTKRGGHLRAALGRQI